METIELASLQEEKKLCLSKRGLVSTIDIRPQSLINNAGDMTW